jgi:hypothetical protein
MYLHAGANYWTFIVPDNVNPSFDIKSHSSVTICSKYQKIRPFGKVNHYLYIADDKILIKLFPEAILV